MIHTLKLPLITTTPTDGAAAGSATTPRPINGRLIGVYLDYSASQPATTDVVVSTPTQTLLTVTNNKTDGWYYPRVQAHDPSGALLTYNGTQGIFEPQVIDDYVTVTVAQGNNNETLQATIRYED